jgi:hypothetical protein
MKGSVSAELQEQRCLIEKQQREIDRQWHHIEMQRRHIYLMQSQLDTVHDALRMPHSCEGSPVTVRAISTLRAFPRADERLKSLSVTFCANEQARAAGGS